ncbi:MAG: hypothetical protein KDA80_06150 [Planctomycetaceae bacterium]|nr:hypothetical protein [Planctomycetaceae bacterium]
MQGLRQSTAFVLMLSIGLVIAPCAHAENPVAPVHDKASVMDVALDANGVLTGQLVDGAGQQIDNAQIAVWQADQQLGTLMTGAEGQFRIRGMKSGIYRLDCPGNSVMCRVWPEEIAPPTARNAVVMVTGDGVARGQYGCFDPITTAALVLGIAGVTLTAITLAKVNDLEDDVARLRSP